MPTKTLDIDISCFSKINEKFLEIPESSTIGVANTTQLYYKPDSDFVICPYTIRKAPQKLITAGIKPENLVLSFFMWDDQLNKFKSLTKYNEYLENALNCGVDKLVQMDFSVWFHDPAPIQLHNMYFNFQRLRQAQDKGFKTILNFNNILVEFFDLYLEIMPKNISTMIIDDNHYNKEIKYQATEIEALKFLLDNFNLSHVIFQTARKKVTHRFQFINELKKRGIKFTLIPSPIKLTNMILSIYGKPKNG